MDSQWRKNAESSWGNTAVWIHGDGQFAVLHPCGDQLTVTLCATMIEAAKVKKDVCGGRCVRSRHVITNLGAAGLPV
jgi:hypothetical protein